ncbi:ABC transporter substrate-binding protein [Geosporobacter ferrireducens]|uniref:Iron ABC transporter substrate-binding protein n=1 Tax=Geosporobacter ferrireducens TaxID=1424294 RepID=A0A1D8GME9_9FIRM|nr:ABC transporter substrate-binding protein [Geosporobacter ferrireducens]AOT72103.1 iron ABC transporter substrate-binding protein [Geosporobacter ferrireducens]MTI55991.1 ABC transporter substrate-binding protein [Geosporobacter ferrireducens]
MGRQYILIVFAVLLMTSSINGCSSVEESKVLHIYAGLYEDHAIKAIEAFEKETGIKVKYVRLSAGEILQRLQKEKDNPRASIWFGGPVDTFIQAKQEGLLTPYLSPNRQKIDDMFKDEEGYWTGIYAGPLAIVSNRLWLQQNGLSVPKSWEELLQSEFKWMIAMPNPNTSGTGYTILATLIQLYGEEEAFDYFRKLHEQIGWYTTSGSTSGRLVGAGDMGVAILFAQDAVKFFKEGFNQIVISFPKEGTGYEIGAVAMIHNGPETEEAQKFIDWILTKQAQELGKQVGNYHLLTNREAVSPAEAFPLSELNVVEYDHEWAGLNRQNILERWNRIIFRK